MLPTHSLSTNHTKSGIIRHTANTLAFIRPRRPVRWLVASCSLLAFLWLLLSHRSHTPAQTELLVPIHSGNDTVDWSNRAGKVKEAFSHAWSHYQRLAGEHDEIRPVSGGRVNNFNGWRVTVIDSLDTLWLMGLHEEFNKSIAFVESMKFQMETRHYASFFETVIRYVGGLLSAHALSGEPVFLARADDLANLLLPAFNTSFGLPTSSVNTQTGETRGGWIRGGALLAEFLSCQMEYKYLAHLTGRQEYYDKVEIAIDLMRDSEPAKDTGLFPVTWGLKTGLPMEKKVSVGASADSAYEYLLKQYLLTSKSEPKGREMYIKAANSIIDKMLYLTPERNLLYVTDLSSTGIGGEPSHIFEHLSCFMGGLFALGVHTLAAELTPLERERHQWAAEGLTYTCYMTYRDQATGLGPDTVKMDVWEEPQWWASGMKNGRWVDHLARWEYKGRNGLPPGLKEVKPEVAGKRDYKTWRPAYLLRPETVESIYILWRTTGDEKWRERGWEIADAILKNTWTHYGFASVKNVDQLYPKGAKGKKDEMPSYFMAETLKYLYLLFMDEDLVPLDKWVFNTESHPFPIFEWDEREKKAYNLTSTLK